MSPPTHPSHIGFCLIICSTNVFGAIAGDYCHKDNKFILYLQRIAMPHVFFEYITSGGKRLSWLMQRLGNNGWNSFVIGALRR